MVILTQRIYERAPLQGYRVLVDRLWPRGVAKEEAKLDGWWKELAPTPELRKWFGHEPAKWEAFGKAYLKELKEQEAVARQCLREVRGPRLLLLYGAKDEQHTHALVLAAYLKTLGR